MKYDDASWHTGGDFPADLPAEAGGTHIAMFVAWCMLHNLAGELHPGELPELLTNLVKRAITPGQWFTSACDEKFTNEDLTDEGNQFAAAYFASDVGAYLADYESTVGRGLPSLYHVPDTWETYDAMSPVIARRFRDWKNPPKWWQLWK